MNSFCAKVLFWLVSLAIAVELIQGLPCGTPSLPPEAKVILQTGRMIYLGCPAYYSLVYRGIMICRNKKWTTYKKLKCLQRDCFNPGVPSNGFQHGSSYFYGDVVTFSCDKCYSLEGHSKRKCMKNGTWSDAQPKCVVKTCLPLKNTTNATVHFSSTNCGDTAKYQCKTPHEVLFGSRLRKCNESQNWSGNEPHCIDRNLNIALGKPTAQSSGDDKWTAPSFRAVDGIKDTDHHQGASCTHTRLQNNPWWRVDLLKEEPVAQVLVVNRGDCCWNRLDGFEVMVGNDPNPRKNARCGGRNRTKQGETIKIECSPILKGRYVVVIVNRWTALTLCEVEVYQLPCGKPSLPPEAKINLQKGRMLFLGCQEHYSLANRGIMVCRNKNWTSYKKLTCLRKGCSNPGVPSKGFKHGLSYFYNDVVTFSCDKCYTLVGSSKRKCLKSGTWSEAQPKCVLKTCSPLKNTTKATVHFSSTNCGDTARYQCKTPHEVLLGPGVRKCNESQNWTGHEPQCIDRNPNIALGKPTAQSSDDDNWSAPSFRAVDGIKDTDYHRGASCTHTRLQTRPWWKVDLLKEEPVGQVIVVNRGDCCWNRLDNFEITVGNDLNPRRNVKCGKYGRTKSGETIKIVCPLNLRGRYVGIILHRRTVLSLCEVEVYRKLT